jgi:hypothetical protein
MLKKLNSQIVIAIIALSCPPLHAQVKADISAKEVDKIKGTLRNKRGQIRMALT